MCIVLPRIATSWSLLPPTCSTDGGFVGDFPSECAGRGFGDGLDRNPGLGAVVGLDDAPLAALGTDDLRNPLVSMESNVDHESPF